MRPHAPRLDCRCAICRKARADDALRDRLSAQRSCGDCRACCTALHVEEVQKPAGTPCLHLAPSGKGCGVYEARPQACRDWACVWRSGSNLLPRDDQRPDQLGVLLDTYVAKGPRGGVQRGDGVLLVYEAAPGAFDRPTEALKDLMRALVERGFVLVVMQEERQAFGPPDKLEAFLRDTPKELLP